MTEENEFRKIEKEIVIERLRQTPPTFKISLGSEEGKFLSRDDLIDEVKNESKIGEETLQVRPVRGLADKIREAVFGELPLGSSKSFSVEAYYDQLNELPRDQAADIFVAHRNK